MIDLHSHIIPNVDDGSRSLEDSVNLIKESIKLGITDIVFTPHFESIPNRMIPNININESFNTFKKLLEDENLNINIFLGNEITISDNLIKDLKNSKCLSINGSKYILFELDFFAAEEEIGELIYELELAGYSVIIAHAERYMYADYKYIEMLVCEGALIQINATSIITKHPFLRKFIMKLIKNNLVHFVSSDVHFGRENKMLEAYQVVAKKFNKDIANKLFIENPRKVLLNQVL